MSSFHGLRNGCKNVSTWSQLLKKLKNRIILRKYLKLCKFQGLESLKLLITSDTLYFHVLKMRCVSSSGFSHSVQLQLFPTTLAMISFFVTNIQWYTIYTFRISHVHLKLLFQLISCPFTVVYISFMHYLSFCTECTRNTKYYIIHDFTTTDTINCELDVQLESFRMLGIL